MSLAEISVRPTAPAGISRIGRRAALPVFAGLTAALACAITGAFALAIGDWTPGALAALPLVALTSVWIAGGAATALIGLAHRPSRPGEPPDGWSPEGRTAVLVTLCGEAPEPLALYLPALRRGLDSAGLDGETGIVVLSDTNEADAAAREASALLPLVRSGAVAYRRRAENIGRKPGNIADWFVAQGDGFDYVLVLDADSRMSAARIRRMIWRMEREPRLGLLQAGIAILPGGSRFGRHQRLSARLLSPNFGRGFAAWTGESGNYWGHNAIMRVAAFRAALDLPRFRGRAPFGGPVLSHDFIEAAWIRRAGWSVVLDPGLAGSGEGAPQTLEGFHRRDRRWCQGNLQHLRLLAEPGLHPLSRVHLASGIVSYLAAPVWLALVGLVATGAVPVSGALPFAVAAFVLALPKLCALASLIGRSRTPRRRRIALRASAFELAVSSLIAPLVMVRQTASVAAVCLGRDCGWKSSRRPRFSLPTGLPEAAAGLAIAVPAVAVGGLAALWLAPVVLPLVGAPFIVRALDAPA